MEVEYAYCDYCGAEYNEIIFLPFVASYASGKTLRCLNCKGEIHNFQRVEEDEGEITTK